MARDCFVLARRTPLSCQSFKANALRLQLHALAYNLANFLGTLALLAEIAQWSMTTLRERLVKIGAKIVRHGRCRGDGAAQSVPANPDRHRGAPVVAAGPMLRIGATLCLSGCQQETCVLMQAYEARLSLTQRSSTNCQGSIWPRRRPAARPAVAECSYGRYPTLAAPALAVNRGNPGG
jgi:hypothetical protein